MEKRNPNAPISGLQRQTIAQIDVLLLVLQREMCVTRDSVRWFANGQQFLQFDMADVLAANFGLEQATQTERRR